MTYLPSIEPIQFRDSSKNKNGSPFDKPKPFPDGTKKKTKTSNFLPPINPNYKPNLEISSINSNNPNSNAIKFNGPEPIRTQGQRTDKRHKTCNDKFLPTKRTIMIKSPDGSQLVALKRNSSDYANKVNDITNESQLFNNGDITSKKSHFIYNKIFVHIKSFCCKSQAGLKNNGFEKINQDTIIENTEMFKTKDINMFGILDGHGEDGHLISSFLSTYFNDYFNNHQAFIGKKPLSIYQILRENDYDIIRACFTNADKELKRRSLEFNPYDSGSTAMIIIQIGNKVISINVGDSRGIMATKKVTIPLSSDHKANLPEEKTRIEKSGGQVIQDGENGPYRVWKANKDYPGLAMSRSLGDLDAKYLGVISDPDINEFTLDGMTKFIILASDGIWEFLSNEVVAGLGWNYFSTNNIEEYCTKLINDANNQWKKEGDSRDDISVVALFL